MSFKLQHPLAITMWDFSWLERRWPGAGQENWDRSLDELKERGYDAVRFDAYPHLLAVDPAKTWELLPEWSVQDWGAPAVTRVQVWPALAEFTRKLKERGMKAGLSTWFREDIDRERMRLGTAADFTRIWSAVLERLDAEDLLDTVLYVDLCNEFPIAPWAPFLHHPGRPEYKRNTREAETLMREAIEGLRLRWPQLNYTFSFCSELDTWREQDVSMLDFLEPHVWMAQASDYYERVGYGYERFDPIGYTNLALNGEAEYRRDQARYDAALMGGIENVAQWSRAGGKALITTECWGLVDYKDFPLLEWGYVKDLCALGVNAAARSGRWAAIATSNFCGPQFRGMWRDVAWHRELTGIIHAAELPPEARG